MKTIFLATSFSGQVNPHSREVVPEFRRAIEDILQALREEGGVEVFCAVEDEKWHTDNQLPEAGVKKDLAKLDASDMLLALIDDKVSAGVQFEIGYAVAKDKQVVIAMRHGEQLPYFDQGAVSGGEVTLITYDTARALKEQLPLAVNAAPAEV